jgi:hypothetical protein
MLRSRPWRPRRAEKIHLSGPAEQRSMMAMTSNIGMTPILSTRQSNSAYSNGGRSIRTRHDFLIGRAGKSRPRGAHGTFRTIQ